MQRPCLVLALLCLAGCATTAGYSKRLNTWMGADETSLVRAWGPPHRAYQSGGVKFLAFVATREAYMPGRPAQLSQEMVNGKSTLVVTEGTKGYSYTRNCETVFELERGRVTSWSWRGNDCKAEEN